MQVDKTEDYEGVSVIRSAYNEGSYVYSHNVPVSNLFFDMIKDGSLTLVPKNKVRERHLFVLHADGKVYLSYRQLSRLQRLFNIEPKDVCLRKFNNEWEMIPCTVYQYIYDLCTLNMFTWDISAGATFMEHKTMGNNIDFYYPKEGVFIFHILHSGKLIWSAYDTSFKRFNNLFIMQQNGIIYVVVVYTDGVTIHRKVLSKWRNRWSTIPAELAKPVLSYVDGIKDLPVHSDTATVPYQVTLSKEAEEKIREHFINIDSSEDTDSSDVEEGNQIEIDSHKLSIDLKRLKKSKSYVFTRTESSLEEKYVITAKSPFVFNKVVERNNLVFEKPEHEPFLLIYSKRAMMSDVVKALSFSQGQIHYQSYSKGHHGWVLRNIPIPSTNEYGFDLDIEKDVDERLALMRFMQMVISFGNSKTQPLVLYLCQEMGDHILLAFGTVSKAITVK
ncbi:Protein of unknown function DUF529 [Babesia duncani]|uniref:Uncharacterized protein n=1 Tax=Babesia duncani TaxID=323732 RepID=A0AAD9PLT0_9APIC|nr:Protein of unknown function DUF529 [Babesia duncani]